MNLSASTHKQIHTLLVSAVIFVLCEAAELPEESNAFHYLSVATVLFRVFT